MRKDPNGLGSSVRDSEVQAQGLESICHHFEVLLHVHVKRRSQEHSGLKLQAVDGGDWSAFLQIVVQAWVHVKTGVPIIYGEAISQLKSGPYGM